MKIMTDSVLAVHKTLYTDVLKIHAIKGQKKQKIYVCFRFPDPT